MTQLTERDLALLRRLRIDGGSRLLRELPSKSTYSTLAERGYVLETALADGSVHVVLTDAGRRAIDSFIN